MAITADDVAPALGHEPASERASLGASRAGRVDAAGHACEYCVAHQLISSRALVCRKLMAETAATMMKMRIARALARP